MDERWIDVRTADGVRLRRDGSRRRRPTQPGLLLHHGLASSQRIWDLMLPRLARRYRVVTYDARGHGRLREALVRLRLRSHRRRRAGRAPRDGAPPAGHRGPFVGRDGRRRARGRAPAPIAGAYLDRRGRRVAPSGDDLGGGEGAAGPAAPDGDAARGVPRGDPQLLGRRRRGDATGGGDRAVPHARAAGRHDPAVPEPREPLQDPARDLGAGRDRAPRTPAGARRRAAGACRRRPGVGGSGPGRIEEDLRAVGAPTTVTSIEGIHDLPLQRPDVLAGRLERFGRAAVR